MRLFLSAGEASGDRYAAGLVERLGSPAEGLGGPRLRAAGASLLADTSRWGAISILESLRVVPRALRAYAEAKRSLARGRPGLFVPVDFGWANIRLARHAKGHGWRVLYLVPPGSWRRDRQGTDLPEITDAIVTPFSWSAEILRGMGGNAHWFGHPLVELLGPPGGGPREGVAVLPGSREHEWRELVPVFARATQGLPVELALPPGAPAEGLARRWTEAGGSPPRVTLGDAAGALRRARAALVCSGTATLEAAILKTPTVVAYRVGRAVAWEARLVGFQRPRFVALPNLLLEREAVPERIQEECVPDRLRADLEGLWADPSDQLAAFEELGPILGPADALTRTAELARTMQ